MNLYSRKLKPDNWLDTFFTIIHVFSKAIRVIATALRCLKYKCNYQPLRMQAKPLTANESRITSKKSIHFDESFHFLQEIIKLSNYMRFLRREAKPRQSTMRSEGLFFRGHGQYTIFLHSRPSERANFRLAQRPESGTFWP